MRNGLIATIGITMLLAVGCAKKTPTPTPAAPQPANNMFVLLPDASGRPVQATVTNAAGTQELTQANTVVRVRNNNTAPSAAAPIDPAEVKRIFGETLGRVPAEEVTFLFYFNEGTTVLTKESEALFPRLLEVAAQRKATLISVTGHTDTTGVSRDSNQRLGMARAEAVAARLRGIGVKAETLLIRSHGQDDLLVPTPLKTAEEKNRRVEVIIR